MLVESENGGGVVQQHIGVEDINALPFSVARSRGVYSAHYQSCLRIQHAEPEEVG